MDKQIRLDKGTVNPYQSEPKPSIIPQPQLDVNEKIQKLLNRIEELERENSNLSKINFDLMMENEKQFEKFRSKPIEFVELDGTVREICYANGDYSVGISNGWETDDDYVDNIKKEEYLRGYNSALNDILNHKDLKSLIDSIDCSNNKELKEKVTKIIGKSNLPPKPEPPKS
jgi:hypothetical protein